MDKKKVGERLRVARVRKNMTQLEVAVALEEYGFTLGQTAIGKIERGERNLCIHEFIAIQNIIDVTFDWIIHGGELKIP